MIISSFKAPHEILSTELVVLPESPSVANYEAAWNSVPIPRFFLNSVIVTTIGSSIKVLLAIFTAYALVFVRFPFKRIVFVLIRSEEHTSELQSRGQLVGRLQLETNM